MPAINFHRQFAGKVEDGSKCQTIRARRQRGDPKPGDRLYLFTGQRTKGCRRLGHATCSNVRSITLTDGAVVIEGLALTDPEDLDWFARLDGFDDWTAMRAWFEGAHGLPFQGLVITWHGFEPAG